MDVFIWILGELCAPKKSKIFFFFSPCQSKLIKKHFFDLLDLNPDDRVCYMNNTA